MTSFRIAVVGTGRMGRRHIAAARMAGGDVVGICDRSATALQNAAEEFSIENSRLYSDAGTMLVSVHVDAVVVATTADTHAELTCATASAGVRFILCEKPMATSLEACDRMIATCREHGALLAVNHQMRFMEQYTIPKRLMESDAFGGLRSATVVAGNFGLSMNGLHYFEMFRFLTDEQPRFVSAWFSPEKVPNPRGERFEDRAGAVRVVTSSGRRLYLDCGADQGHGVNVIYAGRLGQIAMDELSGSMVSAPRDEEHRGLPTTRYGMPGPRVSEAITPADVIAPTADVLRALLSGNGYPTGEDSRRAVAVLVGAYVSDESGHSTVDLDRDELPVAREFPWA